MASVAVARFPRCESHPNSGVAEPAEISPSQSFVGGSSRELIGRCLVCKSFAVSRSPRPTCLGPVEGHIFSYANQRSRATFGYPQDCMYLRQLGPRQAMLEQSQALRHE